MPNLVGLPCDRHFTLVSYQRAVAYRWHLATVAHPTADTGNARIETVLMIEWDLRWSAYRTTLHQEASWTEYGTRHHSRDPHRVMTLGLTRAARFNAARMGGVAYAALTSLGPGHAAWFDAGALVDRPCLLAA